MSFASETKKELTQLDPKECCARAELAALIRMNGSISLRNREIDVAISTENAAIARRIYTLIKRLFAYDLELLVRKKMRLKKNNVYIVKIKSEAKELLKNLTIITDQFMFTHTIDPSLIANDCCKRSYLRGAFLAGGSVNHPESSYHLEIASVYEDHSQSLCELMNEFHLNAKMLERKNGYIVYLKEAEKITDFLNLTGAHRALLFFEDVRIVKDMRNSVNRLVNCDTANLNKTVDAAMRQVANIRYIEEEIGLDRLPDKLREVAYLRLQHQHLTLKELSEISENKISKSGMNHRLRKIDQIAEKIRRGEKESLNI